MDKKYSYEEQITWIVNGIDEESKSALDFFYSSYSPSSRAGVCSMVRGVCSDLQKYSFSKFTYSDYLLLTENEQRDTQKRLKQSFFRFLYVFDIIEDQTGFEHCYWDKSSLVEKFDAKVNKQKSQNKNQKKSKTYLNMSDLEKLRAFCDSAQSFSDLRLAFCFYALFYLSMKVEELRDLSKDQYDDGIIITEESEYYVNEKFSSFLEEMFKKGIGFGQLNDYVDKLGNILNIEHLLPRNIKCSNEMYSNVCPVCGQKVLCFSDRWGVLNDTIVCSECIETLVGKESVKKNKLNNRLVSYSIELTPKEQLQDIEHMVSSFDDIKKSINTSKNYEDINRFLKLIGNLGEKYVIEYERKQLAALGSNFSDLVDGSYALDGTNGFDILSYTEKGEKKYIEVKTTTGDVSEPFYISANEVEIAEKIKSSGQIYKLYRVGHILSSEVTMIIYDDFDSFDTENVLYKKVLHKE